MSDLIRSTQLGLELLGSSYNVDIRATLGGAEVLYQPASTVSSTQIYLEVLTKAFTPVPYVPDDAIPWTILPDWGIDSSSGVTESLSWKTDVLTSQTGVEQRRRIRATPRMSISANYIIWKHKRRLFDAFLTGQGGSNFHLPVWWEKYGIQNDVSVGDFVLSFDTVGADIRPGTLVMLLSKNGFDYEMARVFLVYPNSLLLANTLQRAWPAGTSVYPTKLAQIGDEDVSMSRHGDEAMEGVLTMEVVEPNPYGVQLPEVTSEPFPQFDFAPSYLDDVTYAYRRLYGKLDNTSAIRLRKDLAGQSLIVQQLDYLMRGKAAYYEFKSRLYFLQGKLQPFRLSSYFNDMQYLSYATTHDTDTAIFIDRCGLTEHIGSNTGGRHNIAIHFRDGTVSVNTIGSVGLASAQVEIVRCQNPWNRTFTAADIKRISYSQVFRQDQDDIEIIHVNDIHGAATCTTTFLSLVDAARNSTPI